MLGWILLALLPILLGAGFAARFVPNNRGKKQPQKQFVVTYPTATKVCVGITLLGMLAVLLATWLLAPEAVNALAIFYWVYVMLIGLLVGLLAVICMTVYEFDGDLIVLHKLGKPVQLYAKDIAALNIRKTDVQVLGKDAKAAPLFTLGIQMQGLDLFFAWAHNHPQIKLQKNGKPIKK